MAPRGDDDDGDYGKEGWGPRTSGPLDAVFTMMGDDRYEPDGGLDGGPGSRHKPPPPAPAAPSDTEDLLAQIVAELGIDPSQLAADGGGGDPYAIFAAGVAAEDRVGVRTTPATYRPGPPIGATGRERARGVQRGPGVIYESVGEALKRFYKMSPSALRHRQALLYAGGFYGDVDLTDIAWGQADEASFGAWSQAVARTARLNAADQKVTYQQVIGEAAKAAGLDEDAFMAALQSGSDDDLEAVLSRVAGDEGKVLDVILSDPNALRATADNAASAVLGRRANASEQRMLISLVHDLQRKGQLARQTAEPGVSGGAAPPGSASGRATSSPSTPHPTRAGRPSSSPASRTRPRRAPTTSRSSSPTFSRCSPRLWTCRG